MKKIFMIIASLLSLATFSYADMCSDITKSFNQLIVQLTNDTNGALSVATDPSQISAIRQSFQLQLTMLQAQKESALVSAGCMNNAPPVPEPETPPSDPVVTPPSDPVVTPPTDPVVTPPSDPVITPSDPVVPPTDPGTTPTDPGTTPTDPGTAPDVSSWPCSLSIRTLLYDFNNDLKNQGVVHAERAARVRQKAAQDFGCNLNSTTRSEDTINLYKSMDPESQKKVRQINRLVRRACNSSHVHTNNCRKQN